MCVVIVVNGFIRRYNVHDAIGLQNTIYCDFHKWSMTADTIDLNYDIFFIGVLWSDIYLGNLV